MRARQAFQINGKVKIAFDMTHSVSAETGGGKSKEGREKERVSAKEQEPNVPLSGVALCV